MGLLAIALAILTLICGFRAIQLWKGSSEVELEPEGIVPVDKTLLQKWWQSASIKASERSTALKKQAARWTAVTAVLACLTVLAGF